MSRNMTLSQFMSMWRHLLWMRILSVGMVRLTQPLYSVCGMVLSSLTIVSAIKCGLLTKEQIILINYKIMDRYFVKRKHKESVAVAIMWDRTTEKYCFVNLTYSHVCTCRFDTK